MIIDSRLISSSSLHALTEAYIGNRHCEKCERHGYPKNILHNGLRKQTLNHDHHEPSLRPTTKLTPSVATPALTAT
jgi:hypothetical protein